MRYIRFKYFFLLLMIFSNCSKSKDDNSNSDMQKFVLENKEYYFKQTSILYHMMIKTDSLENVKDTMWYTKVNDTHSIYFHQDTVLRDTIYKFVWYKTIDKDYKIGIIREAADGKVYYRKSTFTPEFLLYDFSLNVVDKFQNLVVKKIEFIDNCNYKRKQLLLTQCCGKDTLYWLQGIGNTNDILNNSFRDECFCFDDGRTIESNAIGGWISETSLLFVKYNLSIIYKSPDYNELPSNFKYIRETSYYK